MPKQEKTLLAIPKQSSFTILTAAALALPGLLPTTANSADGDSIDFQYSHYQEGKRDADIPFVFYDIATQGYKNGTAKNYRNPIEVDSIHGGARISLTDRIKFSFNYLEDTWSGATPIATTGRHGLKVKTDKFLDENGKPTLVTGATPTNAYVDKNGNRFYTSIDTTSGQLSSYLKDDMVHIMSYASPETRKQGDFKLSYAWD